MQLQLSDSFTGTLTTGQDGRIAREFTRRWAIDDKWSYSDAEEAAQLLAPADFAGHRRQRLEVRPLGDGWWEVTAAYALPDISQDDPEGDGGDKAAVNSVSVDTTGGTEHITQAYYDGQGAWGGEDKYGENAPDFFGALNVSGDSVQGVDVVVPSFNFSETWTWPAGLVTDGYVGTLYQQTGTINSDKWRIFAPGEVLFLGARFDRKRDDPVVSIVYQFSARPNRAGFKVGEISVSAKKGWQYMWIRYEDKTEGSSLIKRPKFVYVNDVYPATAFASLGIGTAPPDLKPRPKPNPDDTAGFDQPGPRPVDWGAGT